MLACLLSRSHNIHQHCARILITLLSFSWGFTHHAPDLPQGSSFGKIILRTPGIDRTGLAIVEYGKGFRGLTYQNIDHDRVAIRTWPAPGLFQSRMGWTQATANPCQRNVHRLFMEICLWRQQFLQSNQLHPLTQALIFGLKDELTQDEKKAFLATGTYHLLVVSGLHVGMLAGFVLVFINIIVRAPYALRLLSGHQFFVASKFVTSFAILLVLLFVIIVGIGTASQRALLIFAIGACKGIPKSRQMQIALFLQSLIFPLGWLNTATLVSWAAYLLIVMIDRKKIFRSTFKTQLFLTMIAAAAFGQLALPGLLINPLLTPLFPIVLVTALIDTVSDHPMATRILDIFLNGIIKIQDLYLQINILESINAPTTGTTRFVFFALSTAFCLKAIGKLSIRPIGNTSPTGNTIRTD